MNNKVYIVAGNRTQAADAAAEHGLAAGEWEYLSHPDRMRGLTLPPEQLVFGFGAESRPDYQEFLALAALVTRA